MSSHAYAAPLTLQPEASRRLGALLIAMHGGGALCALLVPLPAVLRAALAVFALASLSHAWRMHIGARRLTRVLWRADGNWELATAEGEPVDARLAPQGYLSPYAVILRFYLEPRGTRALVILRDSLDAEVFRRLRVRLRLEAATPEPDRQRTP